MISTEEQQRVIHMKAYCEQHEGSNKNGVNSTLFMIRLFERESGMTFTPVDEANKLHTILLH